MHKESKKYSARVSEDLRDAIVASAEMLLRGFLEYLKRNPHAFSPPPSLTEMRDTALLCLYRILFIFFAESRDARLRNHTPYVKRYSLERLVGKLMPLRLNTIPETCASYWKQLLDLFIIYDQGMPAGPGLRNIPPRGGSLFSEKTKGGGFLTRIALPDKLVALLLLTIGTRRPRLRRGRGRLSFREIDVEQLGAVYETLLDYDPRIAQETMIEARVQGNDFVLVPSELCRLCRQKKLHLKGNPDIVRGTAAESLHPIFAEEESASMEGADNAAREGSAEENSAEHGGRGVTRVATSRLIGRLEKGDLYFAPGSSRKSSGAYYTCEEIVRYLVQNSLHDLVEERSPPEIESLTIIDPSCGSGHFLVGAARYLGKKLHEAYRNECGGDPPSEFYPNRSLTSEIREEWEKAGATWCRRRIVEKCLFGVDLNPTAVQLTQVALWIESLAGDRPLTFLSHHIRCGNSLLGTWLDRFHEPPRSALERRRGQRDLWEHTIGMDIANALNERSMIDREPPAEVKSDTPGEYRYKADRLARADSLTQHARLLFDLRNASAFLPSLWSDMNYVLRSPDLEGYAKSRPWWGEFEKIRSRERFFHWELEFPEIFRGRKRGFDCVLGNPPWDKVKPDRKEFYGRADVLIRAYTGGELDARIRELHCVDPALKVDFERYVESVKTSAAILKGCGDYTFTDWEINGRSTGGDADLFKFFVERAHKILREGGRMGFVVPGAIYTNAGCTGLRNLMLDKSQVRAFCGFENRKKIFTIHSSYKFACLIIEKKLPDTQRDAGFKAAFMRHDIEELATGPPEGVQVLIKKSELERLSPSTLAFLEYRSERDRDIVLKMYGLLPGMEPRPLLGDQGPETWNAKFYREFDMTNDRELWTKPDGTLWTPKEICGLDWPSDHTIPFSDVRAAMDERGFWPLYEGKHIEQFLTDIIPIERWVSLESHHAKYGTAPEKGPWTVVRRIASNTNERTLIAAHLIEKSCTNDNCPKLITPKNSDLVVTILNTIAVDYILRMRGIVSTVNYIHALRIPVPRHSESQGIDPIGTRSAAGTTIQHGSELSDMWPEIWQSNMVIARAYGLTPDDLAHILSTFPVFARKRPAFYAYLQQKVKRWSRAE
ncbi:MAG: N-6 DNA methylase [Candidatus Aureabacteria bacterium]|nr:N-6 DNA methylase [Candidatus Auribacterota bacterium]